VTPEIRKAAITKPHDRDRLALWIEAFCGFKPHRDARIEGNDSQLDYLAAAFFAEYRNGVFIAARNAGKSYCAALSILLDGWFCPGVKIAVAAFKRSQADFIYEYLEKFLDHFEGIIGEKVAARTKDAVTFKNGSTVRFFSGGSSTSNVRGFHPDKLYIDEADAWSFETFDGVANCMEATGKYEPRFDVLSTNYSLSGDGVVLRQIERCAEFNRTKPATLKPHRVFKVNVLDVLEKCDDRYQCSSCSLFPYCKGKAKQGEGYITVEHTLQTLYSSSRQKFESEMLLMRPSSDFTYFVNWDRTKNILDDDRAYDPALESYVIFDFGAGRCPHAALLIQSSPPETKGGPRTYYVIDEWTEDGTLERMVQRMKAKYPRLLDAECFFDPKGGETPHIREAKSYATVLRLEGFHPRSKQLKRRQTFELIHMLVAPAAGPPKLFVNSRCKGLIAQIERAEHEVKKGRVDPEPADLKPDDLLDCLRMCIGWTCGTYAKHGGKRAIFW
jgi:hypothetical protein